MADVVLLVFEGERTEPAISKNLEKHYFNSVGGTVIRATFGAEIYQLWQKVAKDEYLDLIELVREASDKNKKAMKDITREQVSQIFLFFDYDGHSSYASDDAIKSMLVHFNDESDKGKLYISYPMVEALKHVKRDIDFSKTTFAVEKGTEYKGHVHCSTDFEDVRKLDRSHWNYIVLENYKKANLIVHGSYQKPEFGQLVQSLMQEHIFEGQLKKYIVPKKEVAVLSAFPFFIIEYFGEKAFNELEEYP